jgi:beta-galactosidase
VEYQPGELRVVAYKDGQHWADATTRTTGPAIALALQPDRGTIRADGADLSFVTLTVIDKDGLLVPRSKNPVRFTLAGPGEIVAVDNGDATRHTPFQAKDIHAYNGLALVIVRSKAGDAAPITLKAEAEGLSSAETVINKDPITPEAAQ